jgi:hypothetical protein
LSQARRAQKGVFNVPVFVNRGLSDHFIALQSAFANTVTTINFDDLAAGTAVTNQYAGLGVTFSNALTWDLSSFAGVSPPIAISDTAGTFMPLPTSPVVATFSLPVTGVSLTGIDVGANGFLFRAYDAEVGGNLLASTQVFGVTEIGTGEFFTLLLNVGGVRRVEFSMVGLFSNIDGLAFDNLSFTATPVPAALPLFATGLGALGLLGWRRKRKQAA